MFNRVIVAFVGSSESGKTTAIESIVKGLTERGYTVASAKRIPEPEFTIDTEGKDTWRHAKAGATAVLSVAPKELAIIKKVSTKKRTLSKLIAEFPDEVDVIILEGFKDLVGQDMTIPKVVAVKTFDEASAALEQYKNILAFISYTSDAKAESEIPFVDIKKELEKLVDLVNRKVSVLVERKRKRQEKITIKIDDKLLPLGDFVQELLRNTVLAMVSSLKGAEIKGEEKVSVVIKRLTRG